MQTPSPYELIECCRQYNEGYHDAMKTRLESDDLNESNFSENDMNSSGNAAFSPGNIHESEYPSNQSDFCNKINVMQQSIAKLSEVVQQFAHQQNVNNDTKSVVSGDSNGKPDIKKLRSKQINDPHKATNTPDCVNFTQLSEADVTLVGDDDSIINMMGLDDHYELSRSTTSHFSKSSHRTLEKRSRTISMKKNSFNKKGNDRNENKSTEKRKALLPVEYSGDS